MMKEIINMLSIMDSFFSWCHKHDFFISGVIVAFNLVNSIQSFNREEDTWGYISLVIAFTIWYIYYKNVNKGEPK
jgi:hypothetical protein